MTTCIACEGFPSELNNPCGLCGATTKEAFDTSAQSDVDIVRARFEKWAKSIYCGYDYTFHPSINSYEEDTLDDAWGGYQAGLAAREDELKGLKEHLLFHESDIAYRINDFYDLRDSFISIIGREPKP